MKSSSRSGGAPCVRQNSSKSACRSAWARRSEPHQPLLEALLLKAARERLLHDEHHAVAACAQHVADANAVVRRAKRALGEEGHGAHPGGDPNVSSQVENARLEPRYRARSLW